MKHPTSSDYLLGIDAGGTKTRALAYRTDDYSPIPASETITGPGNLADSPDDAVRSILDAAERCSEAAHARTGGACLHLTLGAAGFSALKPGSRRTAPGSATRSSPCTRISTPTKRA